MTVTRRHGANRRDDSAPRAVNGKRALLYGYQGAQPWQPGAPESDPVCGERCGTNAGWNLHQRDKRTAKALGVPEPAECEPCRQAHTDYVAEWRLRTERVKTRRVRLTAAELALLRSVRGDAA